MIKPPTVGWKVKEGSFPPPSLPPHPPPPPPLPIPRVENFLAGLVEKLLVEGTVKLLSITPKIDCNDMDVC